MKIIEARHFLEQLRFGIGRGPVQAGRGDLYVVMAELCAGAVP